MQEEQIPTVDKQKENFPPFLCDVSRETSGEKAGCFTVCLKNFCIPDTIFCYNKIKDNTA